MSARSATDAIHAHSLRRLRAQVCEAAAAFDPNVLDRHGAVEVMEQWSMIAHAADAALAMAIVRPLRTSCSH
jgi:ketosteroid isomerase-like protein